MSEPNESARVIAEELDRMTIAYMKARTELAEITHLITGYLTTYSPARDATPIVAWLTKSPSEEESGRFVCQLCRSDSFTPGSPEDIAHALGYREGVRNERKRAGKPPTPYYLP